VANLSDRGKGLPYNSELPDRALSLFDGKASWQKSASSTEEAHLGKLLFPGRAEEATQVKLLPPIRGMGAHVQYNSLYKVTMFVEGRKWLPLKFPSRRTRAWVCLVESLPQFETYGIWARRRGREPSDQVSADGPVHPVRWLEDVPASYHEVGLVRRDLMDVVRQPRVLIILLIPMTAAASGICSIRPLRLERQDKQRILQCLASGVVHVPLGCFRFHPGLLVLHLLDEAGVLSVSEFMSGDSTYVASRQLKPMGSSGALTCGINLQMLYPLDEAGQVFSDKPRQHNSNFNTKFEWDELSQLYQRVEDATVRAVGVYCGMGQSPRFGYRFSRSCRIDSPVNPISGSMCFDSARRQSFRRKSNSICTK